MVTDKDTIVAIASAQGKASIGVVRLSGTKALDICKSIIGFSPEPRHAHYCDLKAEDASLLDRGIVLYFKAPHSFTGEDVLEFQVHGGPIVVEMLLQEILAKNACRLARPGEFSERAFLNDKMDLTQAEAVADLINASSIHAAKQALASLQGHFSLLVNELLHELTALRVHVESAIDFPEEEIDFLNDGEIERELHSTIEAVKRVLDGAEQGAIVRDGIKVVIAGKPNAGKSSLLNTLAQRDIAIVTDIAGTTRDVLKEFVHIDGVPLHVIDTAGLRDSDDPIEKLGIDRAWEEISSSNAILLVCDQAELEFNSEADLYIEKLLSSKALREKITIVINKIDLIEGDSDQVIMQKRRSLSQHSLLRELDLPILSVSAKTSSGLDALRQHLKSLAGVTQTENLGFSARTRHVNILRNTLRHLMDGELQLQKYSAGELLAEDLRLAQHALSEITGDFTSDDLLGEIFSSFCIGK